MTFIYVYMHSYNKGCGFNYPNLLRCATFGTIYFILTFQIEDIQFINIL